MLSKRPLIAGNWKMHKTVAEARALLHDLRAAALPRDVRFTDMPAELRDKYQYFTQARMERLRAAGYVRPFTTLEAGVSSYVKDHLATDDPYR